MQAKTIQILNISSSKSPALFLDRDGVVNKNHGYVHTIEDFEFMPHIFELVKAANKASFKVIIVTNQSGIARGFYTEQEFEQLTTWMLTQFNHNGCDVADVLYCPHHPEHGKGVYAIHCDCRKPQVGMALRTAQQHNVDLAGSIMVGDSLTDLEFAVNAHMKQAFYVKSNHNSILDVQSFSQKLQVTEVDSLQMIVSYFQSK